VGVIAPPVIAVGAIAVGAVAAAVVLVGGTGVSVALPQAVSANDMTMKNDRIHFRCVILLSSLYWLV